MLSALGTSFLPEVSRQPLADTVSPPANLCLRRRLISREVANQEPVTAHGEVAVQAVIVADTIRKPEG